MLQHSTVRPRPAQMRALDDLALEDLESVRLILRGDSVIDWHRLHFREHGDVDRFLRVNEFDPAAPAEMARLEELRDQAVEYLVHALGMAIPAHVAEIVPARDLFLIASREGPNQRFACVVLKVMHIVHHITGREAVVRLPISDDAVFRAIELKVMQVVEELQAAGAPIAEFQWSRKPRDSVVTKLLAKRSTLAAKIYDKLRFRLIVREQGDLMPMLALLARQVVPFNYVIPGESVNRLLSFEDALRGSDRAAGLARRLQPDGPCDPTPFGLLGTGPNEFSGKDYRIVNFVADLPLRLDALLAPESVPPDCGHVVFVLTEFQLADDTTARLNEQGESSHEAYKARQRDKVRQRLMCAPNEPGSYVND